MVDRQRAPPATSAPLVVATRGAGSGSRFVHALDLAGSRAGAPTRRRADAAAGRRAGVTGGGRCRAGPERARPAAGSGRDRDEPWLPELEPSPGFAARSAVRRTDRVSAGASRSGETHARSEEHTSELQSLTNLVCRLLLEKKNTLLAALLSND